MRGAVLVGRPRRPGPTRGRVVQKAAPPIVWAMAATIKREPGGTR